MSRARSGTSRNEPLTRCGGNGPEIRAGWDCVLPGPGASSGGRLSFSGVAHVGHLPSARIVGLSKLARTGDHFGRRPQAQERLTMQIARHLDARLSPAESAS